LEDKDVKLVRKSETDIYHMIITTLADPPEPLSLLEFLISHHSVYFFLTHELLRTVFS
jgi:lysine/ornithine N-monooxygenase